MLDARGRLCCLLRVWQTSAPTTLLISGGMQGVLPCSLGTINAGAHNTVDAQRHVGESYRMGVNGAHNTVGENVGAYNTAWILSCQGGRRVLFLQVYRVRSPVLRFDLCALPYFLRPFPGPYLAGVPDRLVPVASECASWRKAVSRGLVHP